jgi:prepilin-type N-terminal cleavage/methylation domain-containing protein
MAQQKNILRNDTGFSLIELLIVVAIIGIIAALAVPNLIAAKRAANEGSAMASMRLIHSCEHGYRAATGSADYGTLIDLHTQFLTDTVLASGIKSGYSFEVHPTAGVYPPQFYITAVPTNASGPGRTGTRRFAMTEDGVLRADTTLTVPSNRTEAEGIAPINN